MADSDEGLDGGEELPESESDSSVVKTLRQKLKDQKTAAANQLEQVQRELALHKAGLSSLNDKQVKALAAAHEGDFTPEALKATALELGIVRDEKTPEAQTPSPQPQQSIVDILNAAAESEETVNATELAAIGRSSDASVGSAPTNVDPTQALMAEMATAKSQDELDAILSKAGLLQQQ